MQSNKKRYYEKLSSVDGIQINCIPLYDQLSDNNFEMPILIQVMSGKLPETHKRNNIELCIVLDRSGSMSGTIESCKNAIECVISKLDKDDLIHLVIYDDKVDTIFKNYTIEHKQEIISKLSSIKERGSTNLYAGIQQGIELLLPEKESNTSSKDNLLIFNLANNINNLFFSSSNDSEEKTKNETRNKILFLFSDGVTNCGITKGEEIGKNIIKLCGENQVKISTFGIGDEYDDILLSSIAFCGNGNYFYIEKHQNIPEIVEMGLNGLTRLWTKDAKIEIENSENIILLDDNQLIDRFTIREFAFQQYLIKAKCPNQKGNLNFILRYSDFDGCEKVKIKSCQWENIENVDLIPNKQVECYMIMDQCSKLNEKISMLMDENKIKNEKKIIETKEEIIGLYKGIIDHDEFGIIGALLHKEKRALKVMKKKGTCSSSAGKQQGYTTISSGNTTKMYNYTKIKDSKKTDVDYGYTSFI